MDVNKEPGSTNYAEAFDRALDKGIVLDAGARMSPTGIDVRGHDAVTVTACTVITSNSHPARRRPDSRDRDDRRRHRGPRGGHRLP